jgi:hypothetical protein
MIKGTLINPNIETRPDELGMDDSLFFHPHGVNLGVEFLCKVA